MIKLLLFIPSSLVVMIAAIDGIYNIADKTDSGVMLWVGIPSLAWWVWSHCDHIQTDLVKCKNLERHTQDTQSDNFRGGE